MCIYIYIYVIYINNDTHNCLSIHALYIYIILSEYYNNIYIYIYIVSEGSTQSDPSGLGLEFLGP